MRTFFLLLLLLAVPFMAHAQGGAGIFQSGQAPNANNVTGTTVTCANTSTAFGVSGSAYLSILVPPTATQNVCFAWGPSAAATTAPPSECFAAGSLFNWGGGTGACIVATGTQTITVETR